MKMNKALCVALALTMSMGALGGCGNKDTKPNEDSQLDSSVSEDIEKEEEVPEIEEPVDVITVASENLRLAYLIDEARPEEDKEVFAVETTNENGVLDLLGLTEEDVEEYAITYSAMNVHAYMVALIKPADDKVDVVTEAVKGYHQSMVASFEQYLPDQFEIASNAIIFENGGYVGIVMCADSESIQSKLEESLDKINDIQIVPEVETETPDASTDNAVEGEADGQDAVEGNAGTDVVVGEGEGNVEEPVANSAEDVVDASKIEDTATSTEDTATSTEDTATSTEDTATSTEDTAGTAAKTN